MKEKTNTSPNSDEKIKNVESNTYKILLYISITISILLILFSFFAPYFFAKKSFSPSLNFSETGQIGDTIGGIMNPFIGIAAIIVTFLAFYIQYKFNEFQINLFRKERETSENKYNKDKFENQFYQMLSLHKENVNELYIKIHKKTEAGVIEENVYGRPVFEKLIDEISIAYIVALYSFNENDITPKKLLNEAYGAFFHGVFEKDRQKHDFFENLLNLKKLIKNFEYSEFDNEIGKYIELDEGFSISEKVEFRIFEGYHHQLAHYYRHLFQTVKFVVRQDENIISYSEKRNYLRILRAQLSNIEQVLLFYNWYSDFGKQWEEDGKNKFFTDYRMIHNLYNDILISVFKLENIFNIEDGYKKEPDRESDNLFEFQDW